MRKILLVAFGAIGLALLLVVIYAWCTRFNDETARADFAREHPDFAIQDVGVGEGNADAAWVHILYCKPGEQRAREDVWQYLRGRGGRWYVNNKETLAGERSPCAR